VSARKAPRRPRRGRPQGAKQAWWRTLLRHERDLPLLFFIELRRRADPKLSLAEIIADAAPRFGKAPRTVERTIKRWGLSLSPSIVLEAQWKLLRAYVAQGGAENVQSAFALIDQHLTEREQEALSEVEFPLVLGIAHARAEANKKARPMPNKKSTTK
jgi:hypothetical protein